MATRSDAKIKLTETEQLSFAKNTYWARAKNPDKGWVYAIGIARDKQPTSRKVGATVNGITQLAWLKPILEALDKEHGTAFVRQSSRLTKNLPKGAFSLNFNERRSFSRALYNVYCQDRVGGWGKAFIEVEKVISNKVSPKERPWNFQTLPWLKPMIDKLEKSKPSQSTEKKNNRGTQPGATKTIFDEDERRQFAEAVFDARHSNKGLDWKGCFAEANKLMPEGRRIGRHYTAPSNMKWLPPLLKEIGEERRKAKLAPAPVVEQEPEVLPKKEAAEGFSDFIIKTIVSAVTQKIGDIMQTPQLENALKEALQPTAKPIEAKPVHTPNNKKRILIVGLLPDQTNQIRNEFGKVFDLRFYGTDVPSSQIRDALNKVDMAIAMTKWISHPTQAVLRRHAGFTFCNGTVTALKDLLSTRI